MTSESERHCYIVPGVSREAFQDVGVRMTTADPELTYYIHGHSYDDMYSGLPCNGTCQVVRSGKVEYITQSDDARRSPGT